MTDAPNPGDQGLDYLDFDALTIRRSGFFELDIDPDEALPLFTARGEELWVPGWTPFILSGDGCEEGTVWVTSGNGQTAYWYVAVYDTAGRQAQYVRVTPGKNAGTVDVRVAPNESGGSRVSVTYQLTGLSPAGNADLETSFSETAYSEMMKDWRDAINASRENLHEHISGV